MISEDVAIRGMPSPAASWRVILTFGSSTLELPIIVTSTEISCPGLGMSGNTFHVGTMKSGSLGFTAIIEISFCEW